MPQMARQWLGLMPASDGTLGLSDLEKPGHQRGSSVPRGWKKFYVQQRKLWAAWEEVASTQTSRSELVAVSPRLPSDLPLIKP